MLSEIFSLIKNVKIVLSFIFPRVLGGGHLGGDCFLFQDGTAKILKILFLNLFSEISVTVIY